MIPRRVWTFTFYYITTIHWRAPFSLCFDLRASSKISRNSMMPRFASWVSICLVIVLMIVFSHFHGHLLYMYHCVSDLEEFHWMVFSADQRFGKFLQELSSKLPLLRARSFADSTGIIAKAGLDCRELGSTDSKRHTHIRTRMRSCAAKWLTMTINLLFSLGGAPTAHCSAVLVLIVWCGPSIPLYEPNNSCKCFWTQDFRCHTARYMAIWL